MESSMGEETPAWWASTLVHVPSLYVQTCSAERWLVCDPTGPGRLAVFDAQAMSLFSLFETPTTISQATHMMIHCSRESIEETITLFYRLGFLRDSTKPAPVLEKEASEVLTAWLHGVIDRLLANEIVPFITVTLSQRNLAGLLDLMRYILEHELPFSVNYYRDNDFCEHTDDLRFADEHIIAAMRLVFALIEEKLPTRSLLNSLLDKVDITAKHRRTCEVGRSYLVIDQNGKVAKCQMEIGHAITTVNADDPLKLVRQDRRGLQVLNVEEKEGCRTCQWRNWCTGGCAAVTYRATGRYDVKSPNCNIYKALFPEVLRLEALRLLRYEEPLSPCHRSFFEQSGKVI